MISMDRVAKNPIMLNTGTDQLHVRIQRGGGGQGGPDPPPPLKNHKHIGFLSNTGLNPLKNHKATKPAFNIGPSSARQRNAIYMPIVAPNGVQTLASR